MNNSNQEDEEEKPEDESLNNENNLLNGGSDKAYLCNAVFSFVQKRRPASANEIEGAYFINDDDFSFHLDAGFEEFKQFVCKFSEKFKDCNGNYFKSDQAPPYDPDDFKEESEIEKLVNKFESINAQKKPSSEDSNKEVSNNNFQNESEDKELPAPKIENNHVPNNELLENSQTVVTESVTE